MTQLEFENKWHGKVIRPKGVYEILNKEYFVTAALIEEGGCSVFAIMAVDYTIENKHYFTFRMSPEEVSKLEDGFEIVGVYNNIAREVLFEFSEIKGEEFVIGYNSGGLLTKEELFFVPQNEYPDVQVGDKIFDICWVSTTRESFRNSFLLKKEDWKNSTNQEIYEKFARIRAWIRGGLYHFSNLTDVINGATQYA